MVHPYLACKPDPADTWSRGLLCRRLVAGRPANGGKGMLHGTVGQRTRHSKSCVPSYPHPRVTAAVQHARRRLSGDGGFTLIELLLVIVIVPVVIGSIALAIITSLQQQSSISNRLTDSSASQLTSETYVRDIQSAALVTTSGSVSGCGSVAGASFLVGLSVPTGTGQTLVSYVTVGSPPTELVRYACGTSTTTANLGGISASQATVGCPSCGAGALGSGWVSASGISGVTLTVTQAVAQTTGPTDTSGFTYNLVGVPRLWSSYTNGLGTGPFSFAPVYLMGSGPDVLDLAKNNDTLSVTGAIYLSSSSAGSVVIGGNNSSITSSTNSFLINNCTTGSGSACTTSVTGSNGGTQPTVTTTSMVDPLAWLPPPSSPTATGSCTPNLSGSVTTCTPGVYTSLPDVSAATVIFNPGNYLFEGTSPLSFGSNSQTITFGSGTYIFNGGISVTANSQTLNGSGVMFYIGNSTAPGNTGNNTATLNFSGNSTTVNLSAMTSGTYSQVLIFQNRSDSYLDATNDEPDLTLTQVSNQNSTYTETGLIYAPDANVLLAGNNTSFSIGGVLSQSLSFGPNQTSVTVSGS
jgi:Tfp pilus assembly protein PilE